MFEKIISLVIESMFTNFLFFFFENDHKLDLAFKFETKKRRVKREIFGRERKANGKEPSLS